jgi:Tol biopolymer transport system component
LELPAFVGFSEDFQIVQELPFSFPVNCGMYNTFPAPSGHVLAIELSCPNGQSVLFLDTGTGTFTLPFPDTDSHFLAWQSDGLAAYLKVDSLSDPRNVRTYLNGRQDVLPIPGFTYDLAAKPDSNDFTFTISRGLGYGSELYLSDADGENTQLLYADQFNYISFVRFSPDGKQIAFIKVPDTQTPFTVGELWVMDADGTNARKLAVSDAGHGYAANWSPDGTKIAFVLRENPEDENANQSSEELISNIYIVDVKSGALTQVTNLMEGYVETPHWSPDGNTLAFNVVINGRMTVSIADVNLVGVGSPNPISVEIKSLVTESACCPAWMRK